MSEALRQCLSALQLTLYATWLNQRESIIFFEELVDSFGFLIGNCTSHHFFCQGPCTMLFNIRGWSIFNVHIHHTELVPVVTHDYWRRSDQLSVAYNRG
jgi:hypothetical protein